MPFLHILLGMLSRLSQPLLLRSALRLSGFCLWGLLLFPTLSFSLTSGDQFLHTTGSQNLLDSTAPTAKSAKSKDSSSINRTAFKEIGAWAATKADAAVKLTALSDLHVWLGLKNSDDQGTNFDLRAELLKNGVVIATGETKDIRGVTSNPTKAKEATVSFGSISDMTIAINDVLSLRISAKVTAQGGHSSAVGLRMYYDAATRPARFGATFTPISTCTTEVCNGKDDDCDTQIDEGFDVGGECTAGVGACARSGVKICAENGLGTVCNATPGSPTAEVCNNIDDNCDGQVNEGLSTISCGQGGCEHTVAACVNGQPEVCTPGTPKAEICENGIDEDCNGSDLPCVKTLDIAITGPANLSSTNQSTLAVTGTVEQTATEVTCNGRPAGINANGFGGNVPLKEGSNIITCVAKDAEGNLGSASITVSLDSTPPRVTIDSPENEAVVTSSPISVTGLVNDLVMGTVNGDEAGVRCNGVEAQVANRRFVVELPLNAGANTVTCIGEDKVGNIDSAHITVTLNTTAQNTIKVTSGNNQTGEIGALLSQPLVVTLTENGNPAVNKIVVFKVLQNDGVLSTTTNTLTARTANSVANAVTADTTEGRILAVNTDTNGQASVQFKLGSWAGAGNNQVEATATGFVGEARFTASAQAGEANSIVVDSGNNQIGAAGQPLPKPFVAVVIDRGSNRLGGVDVAFRVKEGGGNFGGQVEKTVKTDSDGRAAAVLTLGPDEGFDNNLVEASFPNNPGFAASFTASGKTVGEPEDTKISGVVLDNSNNPIEGVTLHVEGTSLTVQSDEQGQFVLQPAPVGKVSLVADGSTAPPRNGLPWPKLVYDLVTIAGRDNTIGMPIYLLPIDTARGLLVDETHGGTLTLDELPGFALTIEKGSATFPDGSKRGTVSVTLVHADKVPMVPNFGQQPRFIITIQPPGTHFNPPAPLTMPNVDGLAPGQKTEMYSFDHDLGSFVSIGPATVSEDGTVIQSDPGVGVVKGGWHCGGNPSTTGSCDSDPCKKAAQDAQDVADNSQGFFDPATKFAESQACIARKACEDKQNMEDPGWLDKVMPKFIDPYRDQTGGWPAVRIVCNKISLTNPFRKDICAAMMAAYHINVDLQNALLMGGCGTDSDWQRVQDQIFSCVDEEGGLFTGLAKPIVQFMRDGVRANCLKARGK